MPHTAPGVHPCLSELQSPLLPHWCAKLTKCWRPKEGKRDRSYRCKRLIKPGCQLWVLPLLKVLLVLSATQRNIIICHWTSSNIIFLSQSLCCTYVCNACASCLFAHAALQPCVTATGLATCPLANMQPKSHSQANLCSSNKANNHQQ